jgi:hypothetical protein
MKSPHSTGISEPQKSLESFSALQQSFEAMMKIIQPFCKEPIKISFRDNSEWYPITKDIEV